MAGLALDLPRPSALLFAQVEEGFPLQAQGVRAPLLDLLGFRDPLPGCEGISLRSTRPYPFSTLSLEVEEVEEVEERGVNPWASNNFLLLDLDTKQWLEVEEAGQGRGAARYWEAAIAARIERTLLGAYLGA